jgi:K+ transporter
LIYFWKCQFELDISDSDNDDDYPSPIPNRNRFNVLTNVPLSTIRNEIELNNIENEIAISVTPGVACFLTEHSRHSPHIFESYIRLLRCVPQMIIFIRIQYARVPFVNPQKRLLIKLYGDIYHITATFGYAETKKQSVYNDIIILAKELYQFPIPDNENQITFLIPNQIIVISKKGFQSWINRWPLYLYSIQKSLVPSPSINIRINQKNTIQIGIIAEL